MEPLREYHKWLTSIAAALLVAALTLPPIAYDAIAWRPLLLAGVASLGVSAWMGVVVVKLITVVELPSDAVGEDVREIVTSRKQHALQRLRLYALPQQILFALGSILVGIALARNLA
ncbi:MAG: hypothetical protein LC808_10480 [Actinobacteria bacterium]|nr:hypothetical protein [Actinomycetota bacterium]